MFPLSSDQKTGPVPQPRLLQSLLHIGFALTGVGTVLLGAILPRVAAQWHLRDKDAGLLLLVQFAGSASGALFARRNLWRTLACGYALCGVGAAAIFALQQSAFPWVLVAFSTFGLGLGLAMTSTNLLVGRQTGSRRGAALALLNFSWSAGAVLCPLAVARIPLETSTGTIFGVTGLLLGCFALLPAMTPVAAPNPQAIGGAHEQSLELPTIIYFALLAFLYVGVEATIGNWISTYATRSASWSLAGSSIALATFWAALLLGRGLTPLTLRLVPEGRLYRASIFLVIGGVFWLLLARNAPSILSAVALTGIALGPIFPLLISLCLAEVGESRNAGWVFAVAGLGGAIFSWLTGLVSTLSTSLRTGLLVPGAAALLMVALAGWHAPRTTFSLDDVA